MESLQKLQQIKTFMLDLDGTFYLGEQLYPWSKGFLERLEQTGRDFLFLTNNSSKNREAYVQKLAKMGVFVPENKVFTSGEATTLLLQQQYPGASVYLVGTPALEQEFAQAGILLTEDKPDLAVLGFDTTLTYQKLCRLCALVRAGIPYIATHPDVNCPVENGFIPDIGGTIALVKACTGREPDLIVGKPYPYITRAVLQKLGQTREQVAMVGDRLYTDIALGGNSGILSILVLSGETAESDLKGADVQPDLVFEHLGRLGDALN